MLTGAGWAEADGGETTRAGHYVDDEPYWSVQAHDAREGWFLISDSSAQQLFNQEKVPNHCLFCLLLLVDLLMEFWETEGIGNRTLHNYPPSLQGKSCMFLSRIFNFYNSHNCLRPYFIIAFYYLCYCSFIFHSIRPIYITHHRTKTQKWTDGKSNCLFFNLCTSMFYLLLYCITSYTFDMCKSDITYLFIYLVGGLA